MKQTAEIYLEYSESVKELLMKNNIDIATILRRAAIEADVRYVESPFMDSEGVTTRDVKTVILVSAVALSLIAPAIVNVINAVKNDAEIVRVVWYEVKPVVDPKTGEILRDKNGDSILNKIPHVEISQPYPTEEEQNIKLDVLKQFSITFSSEVKEKSK